MKAAHPPAPTQDNVYQPYQSSQPNNNELSFVNYDQNLYSNSAPAYPNASVTGSNQIYSGQLMMMQTTLMTPAASMPSVPSNPIFMHKELEETPNNI